MISALRRIDSCSGRIVLSAAVVLLAALALLAPRVPWAEGAYTAKITNATDTAGTNPYFTCAQAVTDTTAGKAYFAYPFGDASGSTTATDASGNGNTGTYSNVTLGTANSTVCPRDAKTVATFNGTSSWVLGPPKTAAAGPNVFSIAAWFKTTVAGGMILGFGNSSSATASSNYDRHLYIGSNGDLYFGVYTNQTWTVNTTTAVNDGKWHFAVGTLSSAGLALYLDGSLVGTNTGTTTAQSFSGFWRVGYDNLNGWPSPPSDFWFTGAIAWPAEYAYALSATQVAQQYAAGH